MKTRKKRTKLTGDIYLLQRTIDERWVPKLKGIPGKSCILCIEYGSEGKISTDCIDCPIASYTGQPQCHGTPYYDYLDCQTLQNAQRMITFLYAVKEFLKDALAYRYKTNINQPKKTQKPKQLPESIGVGDTVRVIDWSSQLQLNRTIGELVPNYEPTEEKKIKKVQGHRYWRLSGSFPLHERPYAVQG